MVHYAIATHQMSERQACVMLNLSRSVYRYKAKSSDDEELREQLHRLPSARKTPAEIAGLNPKIWRIAGDIPLVHPPPV